MILDLLDYDDILNMRSSLYLHIEESYWRSRTPKMSVFELQDVPQESLDWEFLCPRLEQLSLSGILRNRRRILRILEGTKDVFEKLRGKAES
jgi:hypothetical protein